MKRASIYEGTRISPMIPKNHFASMSFFREEPLITWTYTDAVLFTAYDIYRSNDFWIDSVIRSGSTFKEALNELGFPRENILIADTGIFELEAKKAGIAKQLGIDIDIELTNKQIFEAYELSGADVLVSPDEIILATDDNSIKTRKIETIQENLLDLLEVTHASTVIGVLQGIEPKYLEELFEFYVSHGVTKFAAGGALPLYWYDKTLFHKVIRYVRDLTKGYWLHSFGLPDVKLLPFYLSDIGMDSVDTSMLLYMTARRKYLIGTQQRPVRLASFENCRCEGCVNLSREMYTQGHDFFVGLYIHNITEAAKVADACTNGSWIPITEDTRIIEDKSYEKVSIKSEQVRNYDREKVPSGWTTADTLIDDE